MENLVLRNPTVNDCRLLFDLRNSTDVREFARNSTLITWDDHKNWFRQRILQFSSEPFWMICTGSHPIGYVRFEDESVNYYRISIAISVAYRGLGLGSLALQDSIYKFKEIFPNSSIKAFVHQGNEASIKLFSRVGFTRVGQKSEFLELELQ